MIYLLARQFSPSIALPCTLSLTFMAYHVSLSQDGRSYSLLMFLGMIGFYFLMKHIQTSRKGYLFLVASLFSILFYTSYSSIPFIVFSQIVCFYRTGEDNRKPRISSFFHLNGITLLLCLPWIVFVISNYKSQPLMDRFHTEAPDSFWTIIYGIINDWAPYYPLMIVSVILLILFPIFSKFRKNAIVLLTVLLIPTVGLYPFYNLFHVTHFVSSRYFIAFLPLFLIILFLSLHGIEENFQAPKRFMKLRLLFVFLFIASNLLILPLYYRSEKQDLRGLGNYLKGELRDGDKIIAGTIAYVPGILHYLGVYPQGRHYIYSSRKVSEKEIEYRFFLSNQNNKFIISYSHTFWMQYAAEGSRLWIVVDGMTAKEIKKNTPSVLKGVFDGSFANFERFPVDASLYLFLWDPKSPEEKGIDILIQ
jgi:hypothetical protein